MLEIDIIVAIDNASNRVEVRATTDCTAVTTARFILENIVLRHGPPKTFHTDQGSNFEFKLIDQLCKMYQIKKTRSSPYHPEGNGAVERENGSIKDLLRPYSFQNQSE